MSYTRTNWVDRNVATPNKYTKSLETSVSVTLVPDTGVVTQAGTPISATNLNKIEDGIGRSHWYAITTNTGNAYSATLDPIPTAYIDGMAVSVKINVDATAASTLNVNGLGTKPLKKANGTDVTNLKANGVYTFRYNATTGNFILQGEGGSGNAVAANLLINKTASTDVGDIVGTMPENGALTVTPSASVQNFGAGHYTGITVQVMPGKRLATATITCAASTSSYTAGAGSAVTAWAAQYSGYNFTPGTIILLSPANNYMVIWKNSALDSSGFVICVGAFSNLASSDSFRNGGVLSVTGTSFNLPWPQGGSTSMNVFIYEA